MSLDFAQLEATRPEAAERVRKLLEPRMNEFIPHSPKGDPAAGKPGNPKQALFLSPIVNQVEEVLYGGAAGGGKSDALLMAALQFATVPGYAALIMRRTFPQLSMEGGLLERSMQWLAPNRRAAWDGLNRRWRFAGGGTLTFGHLADSKAIYNYGSTEWQYIGFDEASEFGFGEYDYLKTRLRKPTDMPVPIRMRTASNPVGAGKEWLQLHYITSGAVNGRLFIGATVEDNPWLDQEYRARLEAIKDPGLRAALRWGDWNAKPEGTKFKREWFRYIPASQLPAMKKVVRNWDLAATEASSKPELRKIGDPDWTAGVLMGLDADGTPYVLDVERGRWNDADVEARVRQTADRDGRRIPIRMEQEGGASGKMTIGHFRRHVLNGLDFAGIPTGGKDKETRANPLAARAGERELVLVQAPWNEAFVDEFCEFPDDRYHDDQVDAAAGAFLYLTGGVRTAATPAAPGGVSGSSYWRGGG